MEFASDNGDSTYTLTCPYCLVEFSHPADTSQQTSCPSCNRTLHLHPTNTHALASPATSREQAAYLRGQFHAYTFGYVAAESPIVMRSSARLWRIGRLLIGLNLVLMAALVWVAPTASLTPVVLGVSYLLALGFLVVRMSLWGSLKILMSNEVRFKDVLRHYYAFEQGYWERLTTHTNYKRAERDGQ